MSSFDKANIITSDITRFAGKIGAKRLSFFSMIRIIITLSVLFALVMLIAR